MKTLLSASGTAVGFEGTGVRFLPALKRHGESLPSGIIGTGARFLLAATREPGGMLLLLAVMTAPGDLFLVE